MGLKNDAVNAGLRAARRIAGDDADASAAITAASLVSGAGRLLVSARQKGAAIREALTKDGVDETPRASREGESPASASLDDLSAKAHAQPDDAGGFKALVAGAVASFKEGVETGPQTGEVREALRGVTETVKGTSLVVVEHAGALAAYVPAVPRFGGMAYRLVAKDSNPDDIAALIDHVKNHDGMVSGFLKRKGFDFLLSRMKDQPDMRVFEALDAFSNNAEERWKALRSILRAIRSEQVPADVAASVIDGFKLMNGKPDAKAQLQALELLATSKHLLSRESGAQVIEAAWTTDADRFRALGVLAPTYNGMTADEIRGFLVLFTAEPTRAKAAKLLRPKLTDPENVGVIDALFTPAKTLKVADFPEIDRLKNAGARLFGSFVDGLRKK